MVSPDSIILEEPERFSEKLEFKKIEKARDPQKEFLKQMERRWNQKAGLQLWRHFIDKYPLINAVYKKRYKKDLEEDKTLVYFNNFKRKTKNFQKRIEIKRQDLRKIGKVIPLHRYTNLQKRFVISKSDMPLYWLTSEFNRAFKTRLSRYAIRDKRLRLLGKKK